jgi:hypothetical protein
MINKIKQLFCNHRFVINNVYQTYLSQGDKQDERVSHEYQMECYLCGKKQSVIKKWKVIQEENEVNEQNDIGALRRWNNGR